MEYTPGRARVQVGGVRAARTEIRGKGTGDAQFPIESVSEQLAREQKHSRKALFGGQKRS